MGTEFDEGDMHEDSKFMRSWDQSRKPDMDDYLSYLEGSCIYTESEWEREKKLHSSYYSSTCRNCKKGLKLYKGGNREYFICEETPECRIQQIALPQCPDCYSSMDVYEDPSGRYLQCLRYNADLEEGEEKCFNREKIEFKPCPICGSPLVKSYSPNLHWECVRSPECFDSSIDYSKMIFVEGGTFQMGGVFEEERPVHAVTIGSFFIDIYEITYEKWTEVRNWALLHDYADLPEGRSGYNPVGRNNPVTGVNWWDAIKWCNARSEKEGLTPIYYTDNTHNMVYRSGQNDINVDAAKWNANGYRLPTEAEWEFAARDGNQNKNYIYSGSDNIWSVAWFSGNSHNYDTNSKYPYATHTVGTKCPNELGIFDMSGNVREWCWDWYGKYSSEAQTDPKGAAIGLYGYGRVLRGGSFQHGDNVCRCINRNRSMPHYRGTNGIPTLDFGFRCVRK